MQMNGLLDTHIKTITLEFFVLFRKLVAIFDCQTGKKLRSIDADLLHPVRIDFLNPNKLVILGM